MGQMNGHYIHQVLEGPKYKELRRRHEEGDLDGTVCATCDQLNIEEESPLIWSNRDPERKSGKLSSSKFRLV